MTFEEDREKLWAMSENELASVKEHLNTLTLVLRNQEHENQEAALDHLAHPVQHLTPVHMLLKILQEKEEKEQNITLADVDEGIDLVIEIAASLQQLEEMFTNPSPHLTLIRGAGEQLTNLKIHLEAVRSRVQANKLATSPTQRPNN